MNNRPVFIIDDDLDEHEIIQDIWQELAVDNPLIFFKSSSAVLTHLMGDPTNPFLIICDVNLPQMDGFELRQKISDHDTIRYKAIPFIFWSTAASNEQIKKAYDYGGHGFFLKGHNYSQIKESLSIIINYWRNSKAPVVI